MGSSLLFLRSAEVGEQSWGGSGHTYTRSQGHAMRYEGGGGGLTSLAYVRCAPVIHHLTGRDE